MCVQVHSTLYTKLEQLRGIMKAEDYKPSQFSGKQNSIPQNENFAIFRYQHADSAESFNFDLIKNSTTLRRFEAQMMGFRNRRT